MPDMEELLTEGKLKNNCGCETGTAQKPKNNLYDFIKQNWDARTWASEGSISSNILHNNSILIVVDSDTWWLSTVYRVSCNCCCSHLKDLLQLFLVLHHNDIGLAVLCYVLTGLRRVGGVDAHSKPTATHSRGRVSTSSFTRTKAWSPAVLVFSAASCMQSAKMTTISIILSSHWLIIRRFREDDDIATLGAKALVCPQALCLGDNGTMETTWLTDEQDLIHLCFSFTWPWSAESTWNQFDEPGVVSLHSYSGGTRTTERGRGCRGIHIKYQCVCGAMTCTNRLRNKCHDPKSSLVVEHPSTALNRGL